MASNTYCTFPQTFLSYQRNKEDKDLYYYINRLWANSRTRVIGERGDWRVENISIVKGIKYNLPRKIPTGMDNYPDSFVRYLQDLLDLNGHSNLIVFLDNQGHENFEILTKDDFLAKFEYPLEEYRYNSWGIIHPNIEYTWGYVAKKIGQMFTAGDVEDFPSESKAYQAAFDN